MPPATVSALPTEIRVTYVHQGSEYWFQIGPEAAPSGYACVVQLHTHMWIDEIAVRPEHRGQGLASQLLKAVIAKFGHRDIRLCCSPFVPDWRPHRPGLDRDRLIHWYGRYGFELDEDGRRLFRPAD
ncbi:GNAT family N-acetyltransferase [Streptomyces sp. 2MCAF27]